MDFIFADDARQTKPSRPNMGALVAIGGVHVPGANVGKLERGIDNLCAETGFPPGEQFKWSPGKRETFMRSHLLAENRIHFFNRVLTLAGEHGARACVVIEDITRRRARRTAKSPEHDVTSLFLERADWSFRSAGGEGVVVIAAPGGGTKDEESFLSDCVELIDNGTEYTELGSISLRVLLAKSRLVRLLQLADIITSCSVARVSGEDTFSPQVFPNIRSLFRSDMGRIGGVGLKLHPDFCFANLYHWLLGDTHWVKNNMGVPLPIRGYPYFESAMENSSTAPC